MHSACRHWRSEDHVSDQCLGPSATGPSSPATPIRAIGRITILSHRMCSEDTVMKRTIFAVVFCLAAASTAVAADDSLAGLIQAGNRDAALYKIAADLARALLERGAKPNVINSYGSSPWALANDWPSQMTGEPRNQYRPT